MTGKQEISIREFVAIEHSRLNFRMPFSQNSLVLVEMTYIQLYTKLSSLPSNLKKEVDDFVDFLLSKNKATENAKRTPGLAKGLIKMKGNFDEPLTDFKDYMQ